MLANMEAKIDANQEKMGCLDIRNEVMAKREQPAKKQQRPV
jgi:hypothetical protein